MKWIYILLVTVTIVRSVHGDNYHPEGRGSRVMPPNRAEMNSNYWIDKAQAAIDARLAHTESTKKARNVVMFLGDGMSMATQAAARTLLGQRRGATGEETEMSFETFPTVGLAKTYCANAQVADSACTATAYLCGVKTNYGVLGLNAAVPRFDCDASTNTSRHVESIVDWALADGRDVGIVTTTRVTHASPAGAYAKSADRDWENDADVKQAGFDTNRCPDIAHQLIHNHPGKEFKVILGGGRANFLPNSVRDVEGTFGSRTDNRNLIEEWQRDKADRNAKYEYIWHREQLMRANDDLPEYLLGLFESGHMQYHLQSNLESEPTLAEMTEVAIRSLSRNEKGFFLFVEGGRIDHAHHDNLVELSLDETLEMDAAVTRAITLLSEDDSLIVVTADHSHVMAFNGYAPRGNDILGLSVTYANDTWDGMPFMTLSYTNGPGFRPHVNGGRPNITAEEDYGTLTWQSPVDVPLDYESHGGEEVAVFARGPRHSMFTGMYEQSHLPHIMAYVACIGPGRHACRSTAHAESATFVIVVIFTLLNFFWQRS